MQVGQRIKKLRNEKGLTQTELAELANISRSYLGDLENGRYNPSLSTLESIAGVLGTTVDYLLAKSLSAIITNRLEEIKMSLSELAEKLNTPIEYLNNIDNIIPTEYDYLMISKIAQVLNLQVGTLRAALSRQEPPFYDTNEKYSAKDDFSDIVAESKINEYRTADKHLSEEKILTLAANRVGHEGPLSEEEMEKIKLAIKIALAKK